MRLLLSGGSHRATLGSIGAISYFLWSDGLPEHGVGRRPDKWDDIDEIVSVSGGSILNAALAGATDTPAEAAARLAEVRNRIGHDRLLPHRTTKRCIIALLGVVTLAALGWLLLAALGVVGPQAMSQSPWSVVIGISIFPLGLNLVRRLAGAYQRDVVDVVTQGRTTPLDSVASTRRHTICASGLASGLPYYFTAGGEPFEPVYGTALGSGYSLADAAKASTALPGTGHVRAPRALRREVLVDGGVSGSFGEQVSTTIRRRPEDTWRSGGEWFAVDAVRHMTSNSRIAQSLQSVSMLSLLGRWLKVSLEATYVNDLVDLGPGQYARLWSPNVLPPAAPDPSRTFRDGSSAAKQPVVDDSLERRKLAELQSRVRSMSLTSMNYAVADLAIVVGFISTLEVRRTLDPAEIAAGLEWLDETFGTGGQLACVWADVEISERNCLNRDSSDAAASR
ncbi:patatin-like phospholipase domain-containing protein [Ilumatobacter coccineus]|uniref:Uncharacterized protein n=1 Tax=Ilumatobacter coccineus (strain NBRC 103263 / KCTC 29153 / YM16-304) TaxID=1313172 RepID=A0A6C7E2R6_ILUCY|nr:patatin-like phospholipase family protein [Ilumatobacter coccineus]BAN01053.1 hypothetical protein YM304_07390 [Ilumatobacter coccineus YM16-304]